MGASPAFGLAFKRAVDPGDGADVRRLRDLANVTIAQDIAGADDHGLGVVKLDGH